MNLWITSASALAASLIVIASVAGCRTTSGSHPDDMTHQGHQEAARAEEREAVEDRASVDPSRVRGGTGQAQVYTHEQHAAAHAAAAEALETRHEAACTGVSDEDMRSCPLHGIEVTAVENREDGVLLVLSGSSAPDDLLRSSQCHAAHGAYFGRTMTGCVFYVRELSVAVDTRDGQTVLILTSTSPDGVSELRQRAQSL